MDKDDHWTNWLARKCHKTHFHRPGKSSPANNTSLLHDGSREAHAILRQAQTEVFNDTVTLGRLHGLGVLGNALDYLKGKDMRDYFSHTLALTEEEDEQLDFDKLFPVSTEPLVQIAPANVPQNS